MVTAPIMFGRLHVLPVVTRFLDAYPDVAVGLVLTDRVAHFLDDQVDVALRIGAAAGQQPDRHAIWDRCGAWSAPVPNIWRERDSHRAATNSRGTA